MRLRAASMGSSLLSPAYLTHFSLKTNSHILRTEPIKTPFPFPLSPFPQKVYIFYMDEQQLLLQIVQSWNIKSDPEYRGFRCAVCQEYRNKAWHHWLRSSGFLVPIHLCDETCEQAFQSETLTFASPPLEKTINLTNPYSLKATGTFEEILEEWNTLAPPALKAFTCDLCEEKLEIDPEDGRRKGYHIWYETRSREVAELHFHRQCFINLN